MAALALAAAAGADHTCLPPELSELICSRLSPAARNGLFCAVRAFGQQPTDHLVTRLSLSVSHLHLAQAHLSEHAHRLARVRTVEIHTPAGDPSPNSCSQLSQSVMFLTSTVPTLHHLTRLDLTTLPLSFMLAAAACLSTAAPPSLDSLCLGSLKDGHATPSCTVAQLWPSLARVASLRSLRMTPANNYVLTAHDSAGLSAVRQLRTLHIDDAYMTASALPPMSGLTKLELSNLTAVNDGLATCLAGHEALRVLDLRNFDDHEQLTDAISDADWASLTGLTSLALCSDCARLEELPPALLVHLPAFTALVTLAVDCAQVTGGFVQSLPSLLELHCLFLEMPALGEGVHVLGLGQLRIVLGFKSPRDAEGNGLPIQSVASTFPRLSVLCVDPPGARDVAPSASQLWPPGPAGCMLHLRSLTTDRGALMPAELAAAVVALRHLHLLLWDMEAHVPVVDALPALRLLGPHLEEVELEDPDGRLDDEGLCALVDCWPRLRDIRLCRSAVTSTGLAKLSHAPCLRSVVLEGCCAVTACGVVALAACWSVERLGVSECPLVSLEDMKGVLRMVGRPQLVIDFPGL